MRNSLTFLTHVAVAATFLDLVSADTGFSANQRSRLSQVRPINVRQQFHMDRVQKFGSHSARLRATTVTDGESDVKMWSPDLATDLEASAGSPVVEVVPPPSTKKSSDVTMDDDYALDTEVVSSFSSSSSSSSSSSTSTSGRSQKHDGKPKKVRLETNFEDEDVLCVSQGGGWSSISREKIDRFVASAQKGPYSGSSDMEMIMAARNGNDADSFPNLVLEGMQGIVRELGPRAGHLVEGAVDVMRTAIGTGSELVFLQPSAQNVVALCDQIEENAAEMEAAKGKELQIILTLRVKDFLLRSSRYDMLTKILQRDRRAYLEIASFLGPRIPRADLPNVQNIPYYPGQPLPNQHLYDKEELDAAAAAAEKSGGWKAARKGKEKGKGKDGLPLVANSVLPKVAYKESVLDKLLLGVFRSLVQKEIGYKSPQRGILGLLDEGTHFKLSPRGTKVMRGGSGSGVITKAPDLPKKAAAATNAVAASTEAKSPAEPKTASPTVAPTAKITDSSLKKDTEITTAAATTATVDTQKVEERPKGKVEAKVEGGKDSLKTVVASAAPAPAPAATTEPLSLKLDSTKAAAVVGAAPVAAATVTKAAAAPSAAKTPVANEVESPSVSAAPRAATGTAVKTAVGVDSSTKQVLNESKKESSKEMVKEEVVVPAAAAVVVSADESTVSTDFAENAKAPKASSVNVEDTTAMAPAQSPAIATPAAATPAVAAASPAVVTRSKSIERMMAKQAVLDDAQKQSSASKPIGTDTGSETKSEAKAEAKAETETKAEPLKAALSAEGSSSTPAKTAAPGDIFSGGDSPTSASASVSVTAVSDGAVAAAAPEMTENRERRENKAELKPASEVLQPPSPSSSSPVSVAGASSSSNNNNNNNNNGGSRVIGGAGPRGVQKSATQSQSQGRGPGINDKAAEAARGMEAMRSQGFAAATETQASISTTENRNRQEKQLERKPETDGDNADDGGGGGGGGSTGVDSYRGSEQGSGVSGAPIAASDRFADLTQTAGNSASGSSAARPKKSYGMGGSSAQQRSSRLGMQLGALSSFPSSSSSSSLSSLSSALSSSKEAAERTMGPDSFLSVDSSPQHEMVKAALGGLLTPVLPPFYRLFMAGIVPSLEKGDPLWLVDLVQSVANLIPEQLGGVREKLRPGTQLGPLPYAPYLTSLVTPPFIAFLLGPTRANRRVDGKRGGMMVDKCKFLQESNCKGLCLHQCKIPAQEYFKDTLGVALTVKPNFETQECQWSWGEEPMPHTEDPDFPRGCIEGCEIKEKIPADVLSY